MEEVLEQVPEIVMMEAPDYSGYLSSLTERVDSMRSIRLQRDLLLRLWLMWELSATERHSGV